MHSAFRRFITIWLVGSAGVLLLFSASVMPGQAQGDDVDCPGALPSRLQIGKPAQATPGLPNNVRDQPLASGAKIGEIPAEAIFMVLEGPVCAEGYAWWRVDYDGLVGWTVEGAGEDYWTVPVDAPDGIIAPWNTGLLTPVLALKGEENVAYGMALNPAHPWVALGTGYPNNVVRVWDYLTGEEIAVFDPEYQNDVRLLSFDQSGELLAISGLVGDPMQIWDMAAGEPLLTFDYAPYALAFSPTADVLAYVDMRDLVLLDMPDGSEILRRGAVQVLVTDLIFDPYGTMLALVENQGLVTLWDVETGEPIAALEHFSAVTGAAFAPDAETLVTVHCREAGDSYQGACRHLKITFWDTQTWERGQVIDLTEPGLILNARARLALSPDGTLLALSEGDLLRLFDVKTGQQLSIYASFPAWTLAFTPDQRYVVGAGTYALVEVWGLPGQ
jgi:WD40 repeat protein